jgi:hypothetical protein
VISTALSVILTVILNLIIIFRGYNPDNRIGSIARTLRATPTNRRRGDLPPLNTGAGSSSGSKAGTPPDGIIAELDMRNPGEYEAAFTRH